MLYPARNSSLSKIYFYVRSKKSNVSYKSLSQLPFKEPDIHDLKIFIDKKFETVVLPLFGVPTPYHISTVKASYFTFFY